MGRSFFLPLAGLPFVLACASAIARADACPPVPPPERNLIGQGYYIDSHKSVVDPVLKAENQALVRPLDDFMRQVAKQSDRWLARDDQAAAQCTLRWIGAWAQGGALLGEMRHVNNDQADYMRQWALATIGLAYLKTRSQAGPAQRALIVPWLVSVAEANLAYWHNPRKRRNNHYYWTGVGIMAAALAAENADLRTQAQSIYRQGVDDIQLDGSLPLEMARGQKALHYHNYALSPLVLMAELAHASGDDWYGYRQNRIDLLARRVAAGYADSRWFAERAGVAQEALSGKGETGWVALYRLRAPDAAPFDRMMQDAPFRSTQMGGDISLMAQRGLLH